MMLSSVDVGLAGPELRATGLADYVVKPITRAGLLKAILRVLGHRREQSVIAESLLRTSNVRPLRILLAEDNAVNQKVALLMLKRQGHMVTVAENGALALEALADEAFDLVLMDIQMPIMNGPDATRAIRERERGTGRHIPIVALTAHALKGDREAYLKVGMDDYLSKPIRAHELNLVLKRWSATGVRDGGAVEGETTDARDRSGRSFPGKRTKCLTVVSKLETGEPLWFGRERKKKTLDECFRGGVDRPGPERANRSGLSAYVELFG